MTEAVETAGTNRAAADLAHCREAIRVGSRSFHTAGRLLPAAMRDPALALYAFCRLADDAVDELGPGADRAAAVLRLSRRLDAIYAGRPADDPADRAFARVVRAHALPRALPEALLEGLAWDAQGRTYETLSDLRAYAARVAAAVGAMMCVLMEVRDRDALARACDLGVAMQLTNIARDVGEDARNGRVYLPLAWLADAGLDPGDLCADPRPSDALGGVVRQVLREAERLYHRAEAGVAALPLRARPGILAARHVYDAIGTRVARQGYDSVTRRAVTGPGAKAFGLGRAMGQAIWVTAMPRSPVLLAAPLDETAFLVDAAADPRPARAAAGERLMRVMSELRAMDGRAARPS